MNAPAPLSLDPHPLLEAGVLVARFPAPLGELPTPSWLRALLDLEPDDPVPLARDESVRKAARDLLRHGGYKPTGRGKPASEYLVRAVDEGKLGSINAAVDVCNVVSLHSGLPISVVDLDRAQAPLRIGLGAPGEAYVFNAAGQEIAVAGLLGLRDAQGPCANGVKDSQRTKTHPGSTRVLTVIWGTHALAGRTAAAVAWYRQLLERVGAAVERAEVLAAP